MDAVERVALERGRTLLVLDTAGGARRGRSTARPAGSRSAPSQRYAGLPDGTLVATTIFAKELVVIRRRLWTDSSRFRSHSLAPDMSRRPGVICG